MLIQTSQGIPLKDEEEEYLKGLEDLESCYFEAEKAIDDAQFDEELLEYLLRRCITEIVYRSEIERYPNAIVFPINELVQSVITRATKRRLF